MDYCNGMYCQSVVDGKILGYSGYIFGSFYAKQVAACLPHPLLLIIYLQKLF